MQITVQFDTSDEDGQALLRTLLGEEPTRPDPVPAKKPPKAKPAPEPVVETVVEETVEEEAVVEDDLVGETYTRADAVQKATELVSAGKSSELKAALAALGAKRVSELPDDKITEFVLSLS